MVNGFVGVNTSYTPVEYIESSGTQYIDTGFKHNQNTRILADIDFSSSSAQYSAPFGSWGGGSTSKRMFGAEWSGTVFTTYYGPGNGYNIGDQSGRKTWDFNKNVYSIGNVSHTSTSTTFQSLYNDLIFCVSNYNGMPTSGKATMKLYSFKIYDNGTLVRDYIPVINESNVACLYDLVGGKFYHNKGTGTFNAGNTTGNAVDLSDKARTILKGYVGTPMSYTPVEYLESDGNQYIDSEITTATIYKVEAVASNTFGLTINNITYGGTVLGARVSSTDSNFQYCNGAYNEFVGLGGNQASLTRNTSTNVLTINYNKATYSVTSTNYNISGSTNITNINTPLNIYVFGLNNNGTGSGGTWRIYSLKMYDSSNNLLRDFVPALDENNVACLYDLVNSNFYYNKGTGTFTTGVAGTPASAGNKARKIISGYVGVTGDVAKLIYRAMTPVNYLESNGTQYIDTGVKAYSDLCTEMQFRAITLKPGYDWGVGVTDYTNGSVFYLPITKGNNANIFEIHQTTTNTSVTTVTADTNDHTIAFNYRATSNSNPCYMYDGTNKGTLATFSQTTNKTIPLFARNWNGTMGKAHIRIHWCKMYNSVTGVMVRDFIPVLDSQGVPCMYDKVTQAFFYNAGTGTFSYG